MKTFFSVLLLSAISAVGQPVQVVSPQAVTNIFYSLFSTNGGTVNITNYFTTNIYNTGLSELVDVPVAIGTLPFGVYRSAGGIYSTDIDESAFDVTRVAEYYLSSTGSDAADGLSWANAKLTLASVITTAGSDSLKLTIAPGTYAGGSFSYPVSLVTTGGVVAFSSRVNVTNASAYLRDITFGRGFIWSVPSASNTLCILGCNFTGTTNASVDLGGLSTLANAGFIYNARSYAYSNANDGFNYHYHNTTSVVQVVEQDCYSKWNGSTIGDNGSTVHDGISIVRLNGIHANNATRQVHDIGSGKMWNCGVLAGGGFIDGHDYAFSNPAEATAIYQECGVLGVSKFMDNSATPTQIIGGVKHMGLGEDALVTGPFTVLGQANANAAAFGLCTVTNLRGGNHASFNIGSATTSAIILSSTNFVVYADTSIQGSLGAFTFFSSLTAADEFRGGSHHDFTIGSTLTTNISIIATNVTFSVDSQVTVPGTFSGYTNTSYLTTAETFRRGGHKDFTIGSSVTTNISVLATNVMFSKDLSVAGQLSGNTFSTPLAAVTTLRGGAHYDFTIGSTLTTNLSVIATNITFTSSTVSLARGGLTIPVLAAAPATPSSGFVTLWASNDAASTFYILRSDGSNVTPP